ncbi:MAG: peptide-methionine (S)-S-oxide reductase MsrA [Proteobacteria bacterium]|nr:peptide-methionine (S)-S-oxide reductase MsrA [Pseudomonadota bacterium]
MPDGEQLIHFINGNLLQPPFPADSESAVFGMGCFWGAEKLFWPLAGVFSTAAGYGGGPTKSPCYQDICTGNTGHAELVRIVYFPGQISYQDLLKVFWEGHDPSQGMRQGNDIGSQYRSVIAYGTAAQKEQALASRESYRKPLDQAGFGKITTEIVPAGEFYLAEEYHQQYLAKNPGGYCGLGGTGIACAVGAEP